MTRAVCAGSAAVLGASLLTFAAPGFSATSTGSSTLISASDSDEDGVLDAKTTAAALSVARSRDEAIEDLSQRTESASVYANPDGSYTRRDFGGVIRIKQSDAWVPVDYTLVKQTDGSYAPKASDLDITVDGGSAKEAARVTRDDGSSLAFTWPTDLPKPSVDGGVATYRISDSTDLVVAVAGSGVTARIRLNTRPAEDDPVFQLGLRADGVEVDQIPAGGLKITDEEGQTVGSTTQLSAWDATKDPAGDPANIVDLDADLDTAGSKGDVTQHTLELTAPDGHLSDPDTVYPVVIDPDISMERTRDTWVRNGDTAKGSDYRLIVGKIDPAASSNSNPARSYLKFYNGIIESRPDIEIVSAEMGLWQYYGYDCNNRRMYVYPVGTQWSDAITWANKPAPVLGNGATHIETNRGATGCGDGWTKIDLTAMAKAWNAGSVDMQGVRLTAGDETKSGFERRFCSMNPDASIGSCGTAARRPYLNVTYRIPVPTDPVVVEGTVQANGVAMPEARVRVQVWPRNSVINALAIGAEVPMWEAGVIQSDLSGKFALAIDRSKIHPTFVDTDGMMSFQLDIASPAGEVMRHNVSIDTSSGDQNPKAVLDFGTTANFDSTNVPQFDGVPVGDPETAPHAELDDIEPEAGDDDPGGDPSLPLEYVPGDVTIPEQMSPTEVAASPEALGVDSAVVDLDPGLAVDLLKSMPRANAVTIQRVAPGSAPAPDPGTDQWVCKDKKVQTYDKSERFQKVYAWSGVRAEHTQTKGTSHTLGLGLYVGSGPWKAHDQLTIKTEKASTSVEPARRHALYNSATYQRIKQECPTWPGLPFDTTVVWVTRSQTVKPTDVTKFHSNQSKIPPVKWDATCQKKVPGSHVTFNESKSLTEEKGISFPGVALSAQSGFTSKTKIAYHIDKTSWMCSPKKKDNMTTAKTVKFWSAAGYRNR